MKNNRRLVVRKGMECLINKIIFKEYDEIPFPYIEFSDGDIFFSYSDILYTMHYGKNYINKHFYTENELKIVDRKFKIKNILQ